MEIMKLVCISDTHCNFVKDLPDGDVLIHAGDWLSRGTMEEFAQFLSYISKWKQQFKHIICVAGNHDRIAESDPTVVKNLLQDNGAIYLQDDLVEIDGITFYGSPWQPAFCNWAFNLPRGAQLAEKWKRIPEKVDVLITHTPPYTILDSVPDDGSVGCEDLLAEVVDRVQPQVHIYGHIHYSYGTLDGLYTSFINASLLDEDYRQVNSPIVVEIKPR